MSVPITRGVSRTISSDRTSHSFTPRWLRAVTSDGNLTIILAFCLIGLLIALNLVFGFPSFQPSLEQLTQILG
jgi:hypothetical protein